MSTWHLNPTGFGTHLDMYDEKSFIVVVSTRCFVNVDSVMKLVFKKFSVKSSTRTASYRMKKEFAKSAPEKPTTTLAPRTACTCSQNVAGMVSTRRGKLLNSCLEAFCNTLLNGPRSCNSYFNCSNTRDFCLSTSRICDVFGTCALQYCQTLVFSERPDWSVMLNDLVSLPTTSCAANGERRRKEGCAIGMWQSGYLRRLEGWLLRTRSFVLASVCHICVRRD
jgi:hypothetical protein